MINDTDRAIVWGDLFQRVPVQDTTDAFDQLAQTIIIMLDVDAPSRLTVNGDLYLLAQAVGNLVDNAVKFVPRGGKVTLRIVPCDDGQTEVVVADNGPGIPDGEKSHVTDRFFRGCSSAGSSDIGLRLSVVEAVARLHEGSLALTDNNPGLVVSLRVPRHRSPEARSPITSTPTSGVGDARERSAPGGTAPDASRPRSEPLESGVSGGCTGTSTCVRNAPVWRG
jgi:hypothetical protein